MHICHLKDYDPNTRPCVECWSEAGAGRASDQRSNVAIPVLGQGYVRLIESWGSDARVVESARMSTQKGFEGWGTPESPGDERLLAYLWRNRHSTPFEFAGLTIEVQAPIMVFRQWHRHRTQSYNEASARYAPLPAVDYVPTSARLFASGNENKQAARRSGSATLDAATAARWLADLRTHYQNAERIYRRGLDAGIPKEVARLALTVARFSKMRASANLLNWLRFERLRLDPHAQYEIRVYAEAVGRLLADRFPRTWALFEEGRGL